MAYERVHPQKELLATPPSTIQANYGSSDDTMREEPSEDVRHRLVQEQTVESREPKHTNLSWRCFGMIIFVLLATALTGVVSGLAIHYTMSNDKHTSYEVIGSQRCNESVPGVSTVYSGVTVGFQAATGSINYQCMPLSSQYIQYYNESNYGNTTVTNSNLVKYSTFLHNTNTLRNSTASCALCQIDGRGATKIMPATYNCPEGWTQEYQGYLMTGGLCVHFDMNQEEIQLSTKYLYLEHDIMWDIPSYSNDNVLSCAVCSK